VLDESTLDCFALHGAFLLAAGLASGQRTPASCRTCWRHRATLALNRSRCPALIVGRPCHSCSGVGPAGPRGRVVALASCRAASASGQVHCPGRPASTACRSVRVLREPMPASIAPLYLSQYGGENSGTTSSTSSCPRSRSRTCKVIFPVSESSVPLPQFHRLLDLVSVRAGQEDDRNVRLADLHRPNRVRIGDEGNGETSPEATAVLCVSSCDAAKDPLQVSSFGHMQQKRMVRAGAAHVQYLQLPARLPRRSPQCLQKVRLAHQSRTRTRQEDAARCQRL
jgi:hypothetical protein